MEEGEEILVSGQVLGSRWRGMEGSLEVRGLKGCWDGRG